MKRLLLILALVVVCLPVGTSTAQQLVEVRRHEHHKPRPGDPDHRPLLPPHWKAWILIGRCEMPVGAVPGYERGEHVDPRAKGGNRWLGVAWNQDWSTKFRGGLGFTQLSWETFRPRSARHIKYMSRATPIQQLWSAEILWNWANRTYPGNGWTAWECAGNLGWRTTNPDDLVRSIGW